MKNPKMFNVMLDMTSKAGRALNALEFGSGLSFEDILEGLVESVLIEARKDPEVMKAVTAAVKERRRAWAASKESHERSVDKREAQLVKLGIKQACDIHRIVMRPGDPALRIRVIPMPSSKPQLKKAA